MPKLSARRRNYKLGDDTMTDSDPSDTVTARHWFCPTCGDEIDIDEECESWPCVECGTEMQPQTQKSEYIPVEALEELVQRLNNPKGKNNLLREVNHYPERGRVEYVSLTAEQCAQELQEIIDSYE